jgi:hypothetical protein
LDMPEQCVGLEMVLKLDIKNHQANLKQWKEIKSSRIWKCWINVSGWKWSFTKMFKFIKQLKRNEKKLKATEFENVESMFQEWNGLLQDIQIHQTNQKQWNGKATNFEKIESIFLYGKAESTNFQNRWTIQYNE